MKIPANVQSLFKKAVKIRESAYAPYSKFKVGASVLTSKKHTFEGCNVENASYGGAVCAERVALLKAVSAGEKKFSDIVVVTDTQTPAAPCGYCLQMMAEFFKPSTRVWLANPKGIQTVHKFSELLKYPFGPKELKGSKV